MFDQIEVPTEVQTPLKIVFLGVDRSDVVFRGGQSSNDAGSPDSLVQVLIGRPRVFNLKDLMHVKGIKVAAEAVHFITDHSFFLVEFVYSLVPPVDHQITSTRLRIELLPVNDQDDVLIYDLYPLDVAENISTPWRVSVNSDLRFCEPNTFTSSQEITAITFPRLSPDIFGSGQHTNMAIWVFDRDIDHPLRGSTTTYCILQVKNLITFLELNINVMVKTNSPKKKNIFFPFSRVVREQSTRSSHNVLLELPVGLHPVDLNTSKNPIAKQPVFFLSYSHTDSQFVEKLASDLQNAGFRIWFDSWSISIGDSIPNSISQALKDSSAYMIVLSPNSVESQWVMSEANSAMMLGKRIFPILYRDCNIPALLGQYKYSDFTLDYSKGLGVLIEGIRTITTVL